MDKAEAIISMIVATHVAMWKIILPVVLACGLVSLIWFPWWGALLVMLFIEALICGAGFFLLSIGSPQ